MGHWAFIVDDIYAEVTRLKAHGVQFRLPGPNFIAEGVNKGGYTIYFSGQDGVTLELLQPPG